MTLLTNSEVHTLSTRNSHKLRRDKNVSVMFQGISLFNEAINKIDPNLRDFDSRIMEYYGYF